MPPLTRGTLAKTHKDDRSMAKQEVLGVHHAANKTLYYNRVAKANTICTFGYSGNIVAVARAFCNLPNSPSALL